MIYAWKLQGLYPVGANTAGEELERIYKQNGKIDPQSVVDESRPEDAPLHKCFEWDDTVAAEEYRKQQARVMIAQITVVKETKDNTPVQVRAYINTTDDYQPISVVLSKPNYNEQMMENALRDMVAFRRKYDTLIALKPVMDAMNAVETVVKAGKKDGRKTAKRAEERPSA